MWIRVKNELINLDLVENIIILPTEIRFNFFGDRITFYKKKELSTTEFDRLKKYLESEVEISFGGE